MSLLKKIATAAVATSMISTAVAVPAQADDTDDLVELSTSTSSNATYSVNTLVGWSISLAFLYLLWYAIVRPAPGTAPIAIPGL